MDTKWFRDRLADRGLSQRALARQMALDAAAVSLMLRGKREMKLTEAAEIARLLGQGNLCCHRTRRRRTVHRASPH